MHDRETADLAAARERLEARACVERGNERCEEEDFKGAVEEYTRAIRIDPEFIEPYVRRGYAYLKKGNWSDREFAEFIKMVEEALDVAEIACLQDDRELADLIKGFKLVGLAAAHEGLEARDYIERGNYYCDQEDFEGAVEEYTRAIHIDPNCTEAYFRRGYVYYNHLSEYEKAIQDGATLIELNPNLALAYSNRGLAYFGRGRYEKAVQDYTKAIELRGAPIDYGRRGDAYWELDKAEEDVERAKAAEERLKAGASS